MAECKLLIGDCREKLKEIPDESIDCVVTSPPYWGLRDYKTAPIDFNDGFIGQLGLEPDPNLYIKHLVDIFDQVKRVLKPSGTCWVNLGDSYSGSNGCGYKETKWPRLYDDDPIKKDADVPDKCLVQIPSRFALEMTARGWILRNEIIWHKPNCRPSSVNDRFTVDFEKVFFFVKSKRYYFKQQLEQYKTNYYGVQYGGTAIKDYENNGVQNPSDTKRRIIESMQKSEGRNKRTVWTISTKPYSGNRNHFAVFPVDLVEPMIKSGCPPDGTVLDIFSGSGTVLEYARKHGLNGIGIELNPEYKELADSRAMLNIPQITSYEE